MIPLPNGFATGLAALVNLAGWRAFAPGVWITDAQVGIATHVESPRPIRHADPSQFEAMEMDFPLRLL